MSVEFWARVDDATGEMFSFGDKPLAGPGPGQSVVSIGLLPFTPDRRTKRYDGAGGIRDATAQEVADFDDARLSAQATQDVDGIKALRAIVLWAAEKHSITPAQARTEIIAKYKGL
jgi:hypothetical protein